MILLVIRHAPAMDREAFATTGLPDGQRPITPTGRRRTRKGFSGLARLWPQIDLVASSGLTRGVQTADLLDEAYGPRLREVWSELEPEASSAAFIARLTSHAAQGVVAVIGHGPSLPNFVSNLLCGADRPFVEMKKGSVVAIDLSRGVGRGKGTLVSAYRPGDLRRVAKSR